MCMYTQVTQKEKKKLFWEMLVIDDDKKRSFYICINLDNYKNKAVRHV